MALKTFPLIYSSATFQAVNPSVNNDGPANTGALPTPSPIAFNVTFSDVTCATDRNCGLLFYTSTVSIDTSALPSGVYGLAKNSWAVTAPAIYAPFVNEIDPLVLATNSTDMVADAGESFVGQILAAAGISGFLTYPPGMQSATGGFLTPDEYDAKYRLTVSLPTCLPAPTGFTVTSGDTQASLAWDAVTGASYYEVYRTLDGDDEAPDAVVGTPTDTSFLDTGLTDGTTYYYAIAAIAPDFGEGVHSVQLSCVPASSG